MASNNSENIWTRVLAQEFPAYAHVSIMFISTLMKFKVAATAGGIIMINEKYRDVIDSEQPYVRNILAHELAHIECNDLCVESKHDGTWKEACIKLGGSGNVNQAIIHPEMNVIQKQVIETYRKFPEVKDAVELQKMAIEELLAKGADVNDLYKVYTTDFNFNMKMK